MAVNLSVVVMHHPSRRDQVPALLAACGPLAVRVVEDPDPTGPPSPLRTAKRAWAAIAPGATHHVVLQDDIMPMAGFAEQLERAVAARPQAGVTLSVQQTSPRNSYAVRRAALAGHPFAEMSSVEWVPTLALALPVADAAALAEYLERFPDSHVDDDHLVRAFCAERGISVFATVPNLVEHADVVTLSLYGDEGYRPVTVFDEHWKLPAGWWDRPVDVRSPEHPDGGGVAVELRESRCGIRSLAVDSGDPLEHPFTWDWRDRAESAGAGPDQIVATWHVAAPLRESHPSLTLELWAAAYLMGADLRRLSAPLPESDQDFVAALRHRAMRSWIEMGLGRSTRQSLTPHDRDTVVDLALAAALTALDQGDEALRRMATREASALRLNPTHTTWLAEPVVRVWVRPHPCPWCGATPDPSALQPTDQIRLLPAEEPAPPNTVTLHALACEWLTAKSILPLVQPSAALPTEFSTRAAATATILSRDPNTPISTLLSEVDSGEWPDVAPDRLPILPASSRTAAGPDTVTSHILTPHAIDPTLTALSSTYRRHLTVADTHR